jgi:hypothetical protein
MLHAIMFSLFAIIGTLVIIVINDMSKVSDDYHALVADGIAESYARANSALMKARERHQRTYAGYLSASGQTLIAEIMAVRGDGGLELRRRGHRRSAPFVRSASEVFPR